MGALTSCSAAPAVVATRSRDLVNVGYPNNDSFFYLLRDVDGKAEAQYVGEASGVVTANWIDRPLLVSPTHGMQSDIVVA